MSNETVHCIECGDEYPLERRRLGFLVCLTCGEELARNARHLIIPVHKSNDIVAGPGEKHLLRGAGCKGGQVLGGGAGDTDDRQSKKPETKEASSRPETQIVRQEEGSEFRPSRQSRKITLNAGDNNDRPRRDPWFKRSGYRR